MNSLRNIFIIGILAVALPACAPITTQSPEGSIRPLNASAEGEDKHLMLFGHDVVAYFPRAHTARAMRRSRV